MPVIRWMRTDGGRYRPAAFFLRRYFVVIRARILGICTLALLCERAESEYEMKDPKKMPGDEPQTDVPPKPHEFPEYEDMPTDIHDDTGPERNREAPIQESPDRAVSDEAADITNE